MEHFVGHCPKPVWFVPGRPETDADSDVENAEGDNDGNGVAGADNIANPVEPVVSVVVPGSVQVSSSVVGGFSAVLYVCVVAVDPDAMDVQPLHVSGSGGWGGGVEEPSPSQVSISVLGASAGQYGGSFPSFSPHLGSVLSVMPSGVSEDVDSGDDASSSLVDL